MKKTVLMLVLAFGLLSVGQVKAEEYKIDGSHSSLAFSVKHMMVSKTTGTFDQYEGSINFDPADLTTFTTDVTIQATSVNTRDVKRDGHLRSPDFFDVATFPTLTFASKSLTKEGDAFVLMGDLTIKGVTKEVSIPVLIEGPVNGIIGLSGSLTINRMDYGVSFNKTLDQGGVAVGNDVKIDINIEAHKQ